MEFTTGGGGPHALTESGAVVAGLVELTDQDVLRSGNTENIRENHSNDVNPALSEVISKFGQIVNHCNSFVASLVS